MKKYKMIGGGIIEGQTAEELVENLRANSLFPEKDKKEYMKAVSRRFFLYYEQVRIRCESASVFIEDLSINGYIKAI